MTDSFSDLGTAAGEILFWPTTELNGGAAYVGRVLIMLVDRDVRVNGLVIWATLAKYGPLSAIVLLTTPETEPYVWLLDRIVEEILSPLKISFLKLTIPGTYDNDKARYHYFLELFDGFLAHVLDRVIVDLTINSSSIAQQLHIAASRAGIKTFQRIELIGPLLNVPPYDKLREGVDYSIQDLPIDAGGAHLRDEMEPLMGRIDLTSNDWDRIEEMLESAFTPAQLARVVETRFRAVHRQIPWEHEGFAQVIHQVVDEANRQGVLAQLLAAAADEVPERADLRDLADAFAGLPAPDPLQRPSGAPKEPNGRTLGVSELPPRILTQPLRRQLVDAVLRIPASDSFEGRTAFLQGLSASLSRIPNNARADLDTIFTQLDGLGRLDSGEWPLLLVIDNILPYAQGFEVHGIISQIKQSLEEAYRDH